MFEFENLAYRLTEHLCLSYHYNVKRFGLHAGIPRQVDRLVQGDSEANQGFATIQLLARHFPN